MTAAQFRLVVIRILRGVGSHRLHSYEIAREITRTTQLTQDEASDMLFDLIDAIVNATPRDRILSFQHGYVIAT